MAIKKRTTSGRAVKKVGRKLIPKRKKAAKKEYNTTAKKKTTSGRAGTPKGHVVYLWSGRGYTLEKFNTKGTRSKEEAINNVGKQIREKNIKGYSITEKQYNDLIKDIMESEDVSEAEAESYIEGDFRGIEGYIYAGKDTYIRAENLKIETVDKDPWPEQKADFNKGMKKKRRIMPKRG